MGGGGVFVLVASSCGKIHGCAETSMNYILLINLALFFLLIYLYDVVFAVPVSYEVNTDNYQK